MKRSLRLCLLASTLAIPLLLSACAGGGDPGAPEASPALAEGVQLDAMDPANWEIGPIIGGENYSRNMPQHPSRHADGWSIDLPNPTAEAGSVHYVTMPTGSLASKTKITMQYRIEADAGVKVVPTKAPELPSILTLYFQRSGDTWTAKGEYEAYRWFASFSSQLPIKQGEHTIAARFDQDWTAVMTSSRASKRYYFQAALANAGRIGFVLGGGDGLGHGVYATGPARLVVTSFKVE